jgi:hypothetical protein
MGWLVGVSPAGGRGLRQNLVNQLDDLAEARHGVR